MDRIADFGGIPGYNSNKYLVDLEHIEKHYSTGDIQTSIILMVGKYIALFSLPSAYITWQFLVLHRVISMALSGVARSTCGSGRCAVFCKDDVNLFLSVLCMRYCICSFMYFI